MNKEIKEKEVCSKHSIEENSVEMDIELLNLGRAIIIILLIFWSGFVFYWHLDILYMFYPNLNDGGFGSNTYTAIILWFITMTIIIIGILIKSLIKEISWSKVFTLLFFSPLFVSIVSIFSANIWLGGKMLAREGDDNYNLYIGKETKIYSTTFSNLNELKAKEINSQGKSIVFVFEPQQLGNTFLNYQDLNIELVNTTYRGVGKTVLFGKINYPSMNTDDGGFNQIKQSYNITSELRKLGLIKILFFGYDHWDLGERLNQMKKKYLNGNIYYEFPARALYFE